MDKKGELKVYLKIDPRGLCTLSVPLIRVFQEGIHSGSNPPARYVLNPRMRRDQDHAEASLVPSVSNQPESRKGTYDPKHTVDRQD